MGVGEKLPIQSTRQAIIHHLQRLGQATVRELGQLLGLTSTGIRQHLTVLERDGLVVAREERGRVGRPTLVYSLTEKAEELFPKLYDELALALLQEVRAAQGKEGLHRALRGAAARLVRPYLGRVEGRPLEARVEQAVQIMGEQGCLAEWRQEGGYFYIDEFTCPFTRVARQEPAVCVLHVEAVKMLVGADTRLTQSLLRGQRACTYRVRAMTDTP